jgi:endo-1,3(4)-beta-glucanase
MFIPCIILLMSLDPRKISVILLSSFFVIGGGLMILSVVRNRFFSGHGPSTATRSQQTVSDQAMTGTVTNQWYSSLFFKEWSDQLFAFPLAFKLDAKGLGISYPRVNATPKTVFASYTEDLKVSFESDFTNKTVLSPDPVSVGLELCAGDRQCMQTRLAHGAPVVGFTVAQEGIVKITAPSSTAIQTDGNQWTIDFQHGKYIVGVKRDHFIPLSEIAQQTSQTITLRLVAADQLIIAIQPDGGSLNETQLGAVVSGSRFTFSEVGQNKLEATVEYLTNSLDQEPVVALLPHQWQHRTDQPIGTYNTLRGQQKLYQTALVTTTYDAPQPITVEKMTATLNATEKKTLAGLIAKTTDEIIQVQAPAGVYENGKHVFKLAQLLEIADAVQEKTAAQKLRQKLTEILTQWLSSEPSSAASPFAYSETPKGVIAKQPNTQFGNELFNDHHFHYGYFLAASGILLDHTPVENKAQLSQRLKPGLDALTTDIANLDISTGYPLLRNFDPYESHSWADGRATTGDGNNQESTSEAVNRWYGIYRLGQALNRQDLVKLGKVGWAMEAEGAQVYWLGQRPELYTFPTGYNFPIASLVWGGKLDFATWFSGLPSHIYGIQFLPISPAMGHVTSPETWAKYKDYGHSTEKNAWNDIYNMVAVANGQKDVNGQPIPNELPQYEGGNSAPWYFLWISYWLKQ